MCNINQKLSHKQAYRYSRGINELIKISKKIIVDTLAMPIGCISMKSRGGHKWRDTLENLNGFSLANVPVRFMLLTENKKQSGLYDTPTA